MKTASIVALLIIASFPILIAPWVFIPIVAAILIAIPIYLGKPISAIGQKTVNSIKAIAVGLAVVVALGFVFWSPWKPQHGSVASRANIFVSRIPGEASSGLSAPVDTTEADRLALRAALQLERQRISVVARALNLYNVARAEYQAQANAGNPDDKLAISLKEFQALFEKTRPDPSDKERALRLLAPEHLDAHLARAATAIDKLELEGTGTLMDSQAIRRFKLGIPNSLSAFELDQLYIAVTNLQDRLKSSLKVQLSVDSTFSVTYNRDENHLISQQDSRIRLGDNPASDIDLTGFFSSTNGQLAPGLFEEVSIQEESSQAQVVSPKQPVFRFRSGNGSILISKRIIRHNAAEPISHGRLPLQFALIHVNWPLPRAHAVTLGLQERGNPNTTWPFILPIENKDDAALSRINVPRYSYYYSAPGIDKVLTTSTADELSPSSAVGNLRALLPGSPQTLRIELAPKYLSNSPSQKLKEYLVIENIFAGAVIWLITVIGLGALKP